MKSWFAVSSWAIVVGTGPVTVSAPPYFHHQRAVVCCGIDGSRYHSSDQVAASDRIVLIARPLPAGSVLLGKNQTSVAIKRFDAVPQVSMKAGPVTMQSIGVAVYANGVIQCTAVARHDGGLQAAMHGGNVAIRVRVFLDVPESPHPLDTGRVLMESQGRYWVARDRSTTIAPITPVPLARESTRFQSSCDVSATHQALIEAHFDEITHVEIELDYLRDR